MTDEAAFLSYRDNFPSSSFLQKYFGETFMIKGNPHRGEINTDLYEHIRRIFDGVLRDGPIHLLRLTENKGRVDIFIEGKPAVWVDSVLEARVLPKKLPLEAFRELSLEFISHCQAGAFQKADWWQWCTKDNSIWIETIQGTHRKRRTLASVLGPTIKS